MLSGISVESAVYTLTTDLLLSKTCDNIGNTLFPEVDLFSLIRLSNTSI